MHVDAVRLQAGPPRPAGSIQIRPTSAPGSLRLMRSAATTTASTAAPIPMAHPLVGLRWEMTKATRCRLAPEADGSSEQIGQLVHHDDDGHPAHEPGDDGVREELGDPAQPEQADEGDDGPHHDGQDPDQVDVVLRAQAGHVPDGHREERRDGGVGPHRTTSAASWSASTGRTAHGAGGEARKKPVIGGMPASREVASYSGIGDDQQGHDRRRGRGPTGRSAAIALQRGEGHEVLHRIDRPCHSPSPRPQPEIRAIFAGRAPDGEAILSS